MPRPEERETEKHRFRCEVRRVLAVRNLSQTRAQTYLQLVRERRGNDAADILLDACSKQWERGNRGEYGTWKR